MRVWQVEVVEGVKGEVGEQCVSVGEAADQARRGLLACEKAEVALYCRRGEVRRDWWGLEWGFGNKILPFTSVL